jgi:hypothetical protein
MFRPDLESTAGSWGALLPTDGPDEARDPLVACIGRIVDPGRQPGGFFTFRLRREADPAISWEAWLEGVFRPTILPHFLAVMDEGLRNHAREICQLDAAFDAELPLDARVPSRLAGDRLLRGLAEAQGLRMVNKWIIWSRKGAMPVHLATMFAAQCAVFCFPVRQSVLAYLKLEWQTAIASRPELRHAPYFQASLARAISLVDQHLAARPRLVILDSAPARQAVS